MFKFISSSEIHKLKEATRTAEQKIRALDIQRSMAETILWHMAEGVLAVDGHGKIISINPAIEKIFDVSEPAMLGKTAREALRNNEIADIIEYALKNAAPLQKEIDIILPIRGSFIIYVSPLEQGGVICVLHDVTELKKLEKYRSEFVANVSHELKTPLATIHSYVQTLSGGAVNDPEHNLDFLCKIDKHVLRLSALIDDILEISQLESKEDLAPFSKVNIIETAGRAVEAVAERCAKKKIILKKEFASADYFVLGLEDHIYRAILNLLENALTYTSEGGSITIYCAKKEDKTVISVADTGIGIPAEHLPRIFERFYRVDQARSRQLGGTGLGLAIVKHVMHIHNGTVTVESEVEKGSKFTLTFPAKTNAY